jgi:hypothetical protein
VQRAPSCGSARPSSPRAHACARSRPPAHRRRPIARALPSARRRPCRRRRHSSRHVRTWLADGAGRAAQTLYGPAGGRVPIVVAMNGTYTEERQPAPWHVCLRAMAPNPCSRSGLAVAARKCTAAAAAAAAAAEIARSMLHVACRALNAACCELHVECCELHVECCMSCAACCMSCAACSCRAQQVARRAERRRTSSLHGAWNTHWSNELHRRNRRSCTRPQPATLH